MGKRPKSKSRQPIAGIIYIFFQFVFVIILSFLGCRKILVTYINSDIVLDALQNEMRAICQFSPDQEFTMKWIDEEGCATLVV
jgi:hypothetical protein